MRPHKKATHPVYDLKVHLIWITKYRYKVLTKPVGLRVCELIRQTCDAKDIEIIQGAVSKDHVHLYISYPPKLSVNEIVKALKGRFSRKIQQEFPHLQKQYWGRHFWLFRNFRGKILGKIHNLLILFLYRQCYFNKKSICHENYGRTDIFGLLVIPLSVQDMLRMK